MYRSCCSHTCSISLQECWIVLIWSVEKTWLNQNQQNVHFMNIWSVKIRQRVIYLQVWECSESCEDVCCMNVLWQSLNSLDFDKEQFSCNYDYSDPPPTQTHINIDCSFAPNTVGHLNDALNGWSKPKVARKNKGLEWIIHQAPDNITHGWVRHILHAPRIWISTP